MALRLTEKSMRQIIENISDQHYAMSAVVVAAIAAQAAALGEACLQISLDNQVDRLDWHQTTARIEQMLRLKNTFIEWCDRDANLMADYMTLKETGAEISGLRIFCEGPVEISRLCLEAADLLQAFRPLVFTQVQDDLEMALNLFAGTAKTALLLLESRLRQWPLPELQQEFGPIQARLTQQIGQLSPVNQINWN